VTSDLRPAEQVEACPFCGSFDLELFESPACFMVCNNCHCEGPYSHDGFDRATALWNQRPPAGAELEIDHGVEED